MFRGLMSMARRILRAIERRIDPQIGTQVTVWRKPRPGRRPPPAAPPSRSPRLAASRRPPAARMPPAGNRNERPLPHVVIDPSAPRGIGTSTPTRRLRQSKASAAIALPQGGTIVMAPVNPLNDDDGLVSRNQALSAGMDGYIKERKWDAYAIAWCEAFPTRADLLRIKGQQITPKDERTPPTAADLSRDMATLHNAYFPNDRKDAKTSFYTPARRLFARYHKAGRPEAVEGVVEQIELDKVRQRIALERQKEAATQPEAEEPWIGALLHASPPHAECVEFFLAGFRNTIYWNGQGLYAKRTDVRGPGKFYKVPDGTKTTSKKVMLREFAQKPLSGGDA